jgi:hypothetical protein
MAREAVTLSVIREVALTVETRDATHGRRMLAALRRAGYRVRPEGAG